MNNKYQQSSYIQSENDLYRIVVSSNPNFNDWLYLRSALWPVTSEEKHRDEMNSILDSDNKVAFLIQSDTDDFYGFAEASLRFEYVNGCSSSPVAYLEGIYISPELRRKGLATRLINQIKSWANDHGCTEIVSDAAINNEESQALHLSLGFVETERMVFFRKLIK
ncbi:GNAT family N-acetyltransferase [Photorhabdus temperata subsp. temperata]|uniref:Aminoglycoside N(6')-acetyltransferase type 1 n=1 Tax=Photorhabdus temperata subsp. temperata Meg1 TaxID=1393735 RepID=A0A081S062_PHOTE|nr:aminoglycoside 6'-N-acetyltransferase [Photorhabdus temperata]KER04315.1 acetyltransferase, ribosomal protein N-acetylase [Photorhabdus temperata subsp. temperata Meg1]